MDAQIKDGHTAKQPEATKNGRESLGCMGRINRAINGSIERLFNALGRFIGRRPILTVLTMLFIAIVLTCGAFRLENETRCASSFLLFTNWCRLSVHIHFHAVRIQLDIGDSQS